MQRATLAVLIVTALLAGCAAGEHTPPPRSSPTPPGLTIEVLYPHEQKEFRAGDELRATLRVSVAAGEAAEPADVSMVLEDETGAVQASFDLTPAGQGVFRSPAWSIPLRASGGLWTLTVRAVLGDALGTATQRIRVTPSTSRVLHDRYGFWLDPPALRGIDPSLVAERGDARNGMIRWGGALPAAHILPSAWIDVQWRQGDFGLTDAEAARRFLLEQIGDLGQSRVRSLDEPQPVTFKAWPGWLVPARGQLRYEQVEWLVFYAPEVDRTYALGTTVVMPPSSFQAPESLRRSFDIDAAWQPTGVAPEPLPALLPGPVLTEPALGAQFTGQRAQILLRWQAIRPLLEDEYYEVALEYAYAEGVPLLRLRTRETSILMPVDLYWKPNCEVFNWSVRLMRSQAGGSEGNSAGTPISFPSLYGYVVWKHSSVEPAPFPPLCPNEQT